MCDGGRLEFSFDSLTETRQGRFAWRGSMGKALAFLPPWRAPEGTSEGRR